MGNNLNLNFSQLAGRSHDVRSIHARWRRVAKNSGLQFATLQSAGSDSVYYLKNRVLKGTISPPTFEGGLYLSAGVHGDEPAAVCGLLEWAERRADFLGELNNILIFPLLNPVGLVENTRRDGFGIDLNRSFQDHQIPLIGAWAEVVRGHRFELALMLHEDYEGQGCYAYELHRQRPLSQSFGAAMLRAASGVIPPDSRGTVDGRRGFSDGLFRRSRKLPDMPEEPEALTLIREGICENAVTFETPSEFGIVDRVEAHFRALDAAVAKL